MRILILITALLTLAVPASAQTAERSGSEKLAIEAAGDTAGSLLGFGSIYLSAQRCDVEDTACILESVFGGIAVGTVTSAAGTYLAGRAFDTEPSLLGASIGAVAGAAAGVGLWHLFTEELDVINGKVPAALTYSITQGITSALMSRLVRSLKN